MHWKSVRRSVSETSVTTMASDGSAGLLTLIKWSDEGQYLREFVRKYELPQVVRIVKGQYLTLGASSSPPSTSSQTVFLWSTAKRLKVAAQCVKFKEGKKVVPVGPKLAIPENYEGWFEILSEEGRAVRCVESVAELARRFPDSCLVRENIKAYVAKGDDLETITDKVRTIVAGETLILVSEVLGTSANYNAKLQADKGGVGGGGGGGKGPGRFLRCFDARGENVYLNFEQRGKFSVIAKEDNISGVHSIKSLLTNKRFPMMVRLVSGKTPVGGKAGSAFVPELRLFASFEEECVMALALQKEHAIVAVPVTAPVKLQAAKNADALCKSKEFARLEDRCRTMVEDITNKIQVFDILLNKEVRQEVVPPKVPYFRRAFSDPQGYRVPPMVDHTKGEQQQQQQDLLLPPDKDDSRYDEIDQIYDYVRGFAPPPKVVTSDGSDYQENARPPPVLSSDGTPSPTKPEPPPIETIPARRVVAPDVLPSSGGVKQCHQQHPLMIPPASLVKRVAENIYERIPRKTPVYDIVGGGGGGLTSGKKNNSSSSSSSARYYVHHARSGKSKIYVKGTGHNHRSGQKCRVYRQNKNFPLMGSVGGVIKEVPPSSRTTVRSSGKSSTASPIFNIRYKSLTNLATLEFNTLDSSNSGGGKTASGAASYIYEDNVNIMKKKVATTTTTKLPRPKSLSNLVKDNNNNKQVDLLLVNNAMNRLADDWRRRCSKHTSSSSSPRSAVSKDSLEKKAAAPGEGGGGPGAGSPDTSSAHRTKRIGTFYL